MTVCDRANFLAETLTQVHRSGQDNVFCAESCQLKHILRNFDLYHNRVTTNFFGKAVSTVLGSLNALDTRYHTRSGQRGIIKTTSHVEPELYKEDMMKILKVVFTIRNTNLSNTNSLFHVLQHNKNWLKVKKQNENSSVT